MANDNSKSNCDNVYHLTGRKCYTKSPRKTKNCSKFSHFNQSNNQSKSLTFNLLNPTTTTAATFKMLNVILLTAICCSLIPSGEAFNGFISGPILNSSSMFTSLALPDDSFDEPIMSDESLPQPQALRLSSSNSNDKAQLPEISLPTVTVRGFLNFRTTVDGTVVVFTSSATPVQSASSSINPLPSSTSKPPSIVPTSTAAVNPFHSYSSAYYDEPPSPVYSPILGSPYNGGKSNYFYKTQNNHHQQQQATVTTITPTSASSSYSAVYPTGLVTILAETELGNNGETTVQETKVIGTYIEGKYAQILKSTSFVNLGHSSTTPTPVISSDIFAVYPSQEVPSPVSTSSPSADKQQHQPKRPVLEEGKFKFESSSEKNSELVTRFTRGDRPQGLFGSSRPSPFKIPTTTTSTPKNGGEATSENARVKIRKLGRLGQGSARFTWTPRANEKVRLNRFKVKVTAENVNPTSRFTARDENEKEAARVLNARLNRRLGPSRSFTTEKPNANIEPPGSSASPTAPFTESPEALTLSKEGGPGDFSGAGESKKATYKNAPLIEGLLSEGSSPAGSPFFSPGSGPRGGPHEQDGFGGPDGQIRPSKVITETVTFTSDVTRGFEGGEPLIEKVTLTNVIEKTIEFDRNPVSESLVQPTLLTGNLFTGPMATPPIILSHTYEVTSSTSRTSLLPLASDSTATVTENFIIRKLITAYKTLPNSVGEATDLVSSLMSEMNNSAYLDTLLAASSVENQIEPTASIGDMATLISSPTQGHSKVTSPSDDSARLPLQLLPSLNSAIGPQIDLNNPLILGAALQNPTLAAMYFGLQQLSQQVTQYTTIYKPTEVPSTETIYSTKTVSFYDGRQTRTRTITEPASTTIKMLSTVTPQVQPVINPQILVQQAQLQRAFASQLLNSQSNSNINNLNNNNNNGNNALLNGLVNNNVLSGLLPNLGQNNNQQQQLGNQLNVNNLPIVASVPQISPSTVTETTVTLITTTSTSSKIYTLIYNAFSTKYRTVTSTTVYPTQITTTITKTITPSATAYPFFG